MPSFSATGLTVTHAQNVSDSIQSLTSASLVTLSSGTLAVAGTLDDSATVKLMGGTLSGATVVSGTTIAATSLGGILDNVNMGGSLDLATNANATVTVTDGMTLNGAVNLGNTSGSTSGTLLFDGTQALSGNGSIVFGGATGNTFEVYRSTTTLTIGPGISLHGKNGNVGISAINGGGSFINQGTISADVANGSFILNGTSWTNQGTIQSDAGATVTLQGSWSGAGKLVVSGGTLNLAGSFTTAGSGIFAPAPASNFSRTGGTVNLSGSLDNTNNTISLDSRTGPWNFTSALDQAFITGGTVNTDGTNNLVVLNGSGSTLSNVTWNGVLDMSTTFNTALTVTNGMTLNGTILLGSADGVNPGSLGFSGNQTLSGTGKILFGGTAANNLYPVPGQGTLIIGPGITLHGKYGTIGARATDGGGPFINQGIIQPDVAGGDFPPPWHRLAESGEDRGGRQRNRQLLRRLVEHRQARREWRHAQPRRLVHDRRLRHLRPGAGLQLQPHRRHGEPERLARQHQQHDLPRLPHWPLELLQRPRPGQNHRRQHQHRWCEQSRCTQQQRHDS